MSNRPPLFFKKHKSLRRNLFSMHVGLLRIVLCMPFSRRSQDCKCGQDGPPALRQKLNGRRTRWVICLRVFNYHQKILCITNITITLPGGKSDMSVGALSSSVSSCCPSISSSLSSSSISQITAESFPKPVLEEYSRPTRAVNEKG